MSPDHDHCTENGHAFPAWRHDEKRKLYFRICWNCLIEETADELRPATRPDIDLEGFEQLDILWEIEGACEYEFEGRGAADIIQRMQQTLGRAYNEIHKLRKVTK